MLYFLPTPIGNLGDITLRTLEILKTCETLFCEDTRVCKSLISLLNSKFNASISVKNFIALHSHNEKELLEKINLDIFNENVAFLSDAGMPCISDPGSELIKFAIKNELKFEVLPGANAALVALVSSGFLQKEFIFLGFLKNTGSARQKEIENLLKNPYASVIYESAKRILSLVLEIAKIDPNRELFAMKEISKKFEAKFRARACDLHELLKNANLNGEWVLIVQKSPLNTGFNASSLCEKDILALDISPKIKSKLLAKMSGKNAKDIYTNLILSQN